MPATLVAHTVASSTAGAPVTTGAIDTTGATFLVAVLSELQSVAAGSVTDSKGNTWTGLTEHHPAANTRGRIFYCANPTVGSGHTFTAANGGSSSFPSIAVAAFTGPISSPFDQQNGNAAQGVAGLTTGSVTPAQDNELVIAGISAGSDTITIDSGFTMVDTANFSNGAHFGVGLAYKVQTTAAAVNPTFSYTLDNTGSATLIATFKTSTPPTGKNVRARFNGSTGITTGTPITSYVTEAADATLVAVGLTLQAGSTGGLNVVNGRATGDETKTLTISATGGTYGLTVGLTGARATPVSTAANALAFNANAAAIQTALVGLANVGAGNATVTGTGPFTVTFANTLGPVTLTPITTNLTGGTASASSAVNAIALFNWTPTNGDYRAQFKWFKVSGGNWSGMCLRWDATARTGLAVNIYSGSSDQIAIVGSSAGSVTTLLSYDPAGRAGDNGDSHIVEVELLGNLAFLFVDGNYAGKCDVSGYPSTGSVGIWCAGSSALLGWHIDDVFIVDGAATLTAPWIGIKRAKSKVKGQTIIQSHHPLGTLNGGAYTPKLYASKQPDFVPDVSNLIATGSSRTYANDPPAFTYSPSDGGLTYYIMTATDGAGTVTYPHIAAVPQKRIVRLFAIGDSFDTARAGGGLLADALLTNYVSLNQDVRYQAKNPTIIDIVARELGRQGYPVEVIDAINRGVGGSKTTNWLPAGHADQDADPAQRYLAAANTAFAASEVYYNQTDVESFTLIMLGGNNAYPSVQTPAATFAAHMLAIANNQIAIADAAGHTRTVFLIEDPHPGRPIESGSGWWNKTSAALVKAYNAVIASLDNGTTIRYVPTGTFAQTAHDSYDDDLDNLESSPHPGYRVIEQWGMAIARGVRELIGGIGGATGTGSVLVNHDTGGTDNYRVINSANGQPVDGAVVYAYIAASVGADTTPDIMPAAETFTGIDGRWLSPLHLNPGQYRLVFGKPGVLKDEELDLTVA